MTLVVPGALSDGSNNICQHLDLALIKLEIVQTLRVVLQETNEDGDQLQLLETLHIVLTHGQLPQGPSDGRHELLVAVVLGVLDESHQGLQATIGLY